MSDIEQTLEERGARYGRYCDVASTSQGIKALINLTLRTEKGDTTDEVLRESLDMIANKLARIANGDPYYRDSWHDIIGYCTLVLNELERSHD